jgi:Tfp pilus assembly pilus retraction ATPase PilT
VFFALAQAIESHRLKYLIRVGRVDSVSEPRAFAVTVQGVRCRVQMVQDGRYHVRVPSDLLALSKLGMPEPLKARLLSSEFNSGGLIVVCGSYGSGKTSTVNAVVRERIEQRGGYALVMGNPIEYEYAGFHGSVAQPGYVEQVDLVGLDLNTEIKASMRNFPAGAVSILAYPELIGSDGVGEMLRAANRGNLVFADMHALNLEASIINLVSMGEQDGEGYARELLGNSLRIVIHQRMVSAPGSPRGVAVQYSAIFINRSMRAAIVDKTMPLSRAITSILSLPNSQ